ncbi:MAG: hypothetical protein HGGPFJEG_00031 [Ignavibacteria bacterium]|nr:hypothetical protein [Ignavibacteria bacterium]
MKIFFIVLIMSLFGDSYSGEFQNNLFINDKGREIRIQPDVMNKSGVINSSGKFSVVNNNETDSFPVFGGFPVIVNGQSYEGGIICQMDSDTELEIVYGIGTTLQAWNPDGSSVSGWPINLSYNAQGAPALGDIDGDGQDEIVLGTSNFFGTAGAIYAFRKNGTAVTGFPVNLGATSRTIVLSDLDNNGALEIITNKRLSSAGEIWIYKGNGTVYPGWPKTINHVPASSSAAGDITGDGIPEIISESYTSLYAWDRDGNLINGFPYSMPYNDVNSYSAPVLADVDGDNIREILFGTHVTGSGGGGFLYILKNNGTVLNGWPKQTNWWIYGPPVLGYVNDDNIIDILVGDQIGSASPSNYVYGWDKNGNVLSGFPIGPINAVNNQIALGDIDNDNRLELLIDDNTQLSGAGKYLAFNHDGTPLNEWTLPVTGTSFFNMPCLGDINSNGILDVIGAGFTAGGSNQTFVYAWNTGITYNAQRIVNPVWQFNTRHNGVYGDNGIVSIGSASSSEIEEFSLSQNYPNPFNPRTIIRFQLSAANFVTLKVYNLLGKGVATLVNERITGGNHQVEFDGSELPSGIYFYELRLGTFSQVKGMLLLK